MPRLLIIFLFVFCFPIFTMQSPVANEPAWMKNYQGKVPSLKNLAADTFIEFFNPANKTMKIDALKDITKSISLPNDLEKYIKEKMVRDKPHMLNSINNAQPEMLCDHFLKILYSKNKEYVLLRTSKATKTQDLTLLHLPSRKKIPLPHKALKHLAHVNIDNFAFTDNDQNLIFIGYQKDHNRPKEAYNFSLETLALTRIENDDQRFTELNNIDRDLFKFVHYCLGRITHVYQGIKINKNLIELCFNDDFKKRDFDNALPPVNKKSTANVTLWLSVINDTNDEYEIMQSVEAPDNASTLQLLYSLTDRKAECLYLKFDGNLYHTSSPTPLLSGIGSMCNNAPWNVNKKLLAHESTTLLPDDSLTYAGKKIDPSTGEIKSPFYIVSLYTALAKKASAQNLLELLIVERQMQEGSVIDPKIIARLMSSPSKRLREVTKERYAAKDIRKKLLPSASFAIASKEYPRAFTPPVFTLSAKKY